MTKRLIDIDDDLLEQAREALGTRTIKDTVTSALARAAQRHRSTQLTDAMLKRFADASRDLRDEDVMRRAWR